MIIARSLHLPDNARAILWDMDGSLLDTLGLDVVLCNRLLQEKLDPSIVLDRDFIRSIFAYHPAEFWRRILAQVSDRYQLAESTLHFEEFLQPYNRVRNATAFEVLPGVREILTRARKSGLILATVSNNPTEDVRRILAQAGILDVMSHVIGNDIGKLEKKPAPDSYLFAASQVGARPEECVVIEDSLIGLEAGRNAGCFTIGVATGSADVESLEESGLADRVYADLRENLGDLQRGHVTQKTIVTPNEFVSHMIEHIAWRMGASIDLRWNNNDWFRLGRMLGKKAKDLGLATKQGVALGMIDDGSAEVAIDLDQPPSAEIQGIPTLDLAWFLACRCEQLSTGQPLVQLIEGLAQGLMGKISIVIWSVEDPHHTWEGVFRSLGIALGRMAPKVAEDSKIPSMEITEIPHGGAIQVERRSLRGAHVARTTAESVVSVAVDFTAATPSSFKIEAPPVIRVSQLGKLLERLAEAAGWSLQIEFDATVLGSSHVVAEDVGLVLGRALKEILVLRMEHLGAYGAGSSLDSVAMLETQPIRVGLSVEGRKCWKLVPYAATPAELRKKFIIGHKVCDELFSEDLDDFLDGLSGGMSCSIMVHIKEMMDPAEGWPLIFGNLGKALKEVFAINPYRKGVSPGVKATLA